MVVLGQILSYPSLVLLTLRPFWDKFGLDGVASEFARRCPLKERESHGCEVSVWSLQQVSNREFLHNWRENFHCFGIDIIATTSSVDCGPDWKVVGKSTTEVRTFVLFYCSHLNLSVHHEATRWWAIVLSTIRSFGYLPEFLCYLSLYLYPISNNLWFDHVS